MLKNNIAIFFGIFLVSMLFVPSSMPPTEAQNTPYYGAIVELDKIYYSWADSVWIYITAPDFNSDPNKIEYIGGKPDNRITMTSSNGKKLDYYKLEETSPDSGVFVGHVLLTGFQHDTDGDGIHDPIMIIEEGECDAPEELGCPGAIRTNLTGASFGKGPWDGRLKAEPGDTFTVRFSETYSGSTNTHDATAFVNWWLAELNLQPSVIKVNEPVTVTVIDEDMDLGLLNRDSLSVNVYSDSDAAGFQLTLTETEILNEDGTSMVFQDSGIFEGEIIFTDCSPIEQQNNICTVNPAAKVLAKPGDTITVAYNDYTLPFPDYLVDDWLTFALTPKMSGIKTPTPEPTTTPEPITTPAQTEIISDSSFKKYTHDNNRFLIEYPDNWVLGEGHPDALAVFDDQYDWETEVQVFLNEDDSLDNRSDSKVLRAIERNQWELCDEYTFAGAGDRKCSDFKVVDSYTMKTNDDRKVYFVKMTYTLEWEDYLPGQEHSMVKTLGLVYDGNNSWEMAVESFERVFANHSDEIMHMMKSFSLNPTQTSTPTPTESVTAIPGWIKNNAGWWADGVIDDSSFLQGIQFLIKEGIMVIPPTETSGSSDSQAVPAWIKNNAGWWADGTIDDNSFVSGIQYLIKVGIIKVN